jgi:hypothetical protein
VRRNCLLKHVIEGKIDARIEVTGREEEDVSSYRMISRTGGYCKLKEEALDRTVRRTGCGRDCEPDVRQCGKND